MASPSSKAAARSGRTPLPQLGLQCPPRGLFLPQAIFGLPVRLRRLVKSPLGLFSRLRLFPQAPQQLPAHRIVETKHFLQRCRRSDREKNKPRLSSRGPLALHVFADD